MKRLTKKEMKHLIGGGGEIAIPPDNTTGKSYTCYDINSNIILAGCFIEAPYLTCALCAGGEVTCNNVEPYSANLC